MRLIPEKLHGFKSIEIAPLRIEVSAEEILADLRYPAPPKLGRRR